MAARVVEDEWVPLPGAMPEVVDADKVYVIPTRTAGKVAERDEFELCFSENVRYLPKAARARGVPVVFSRPEGERHYLQEFSIDPEVWTLGLALFSVASDWLIFTVSLFIEHRAQHQGWSRQDAEQLPLKVSVAETKTKRTFKVEGTGAEVIEALKLLQRETLKREGYEQDGGR